eukprot:g5159.t1
MTAMAETMAGEYCPEVRVDPPALEEVIRELDRDTKHVGRPMRSPRRPEWRADPFHFPSDARKWLEPWERTALVQACDEVDPGRLGRIPVAAIGKVLAAVGSESLVARAERTLPRERAPRRFGAGEETVAFSSLVDLLTESFRLVRQPFGGKRCIVGRIPLPPCCENSHCAAHLEKPTSATLEAADDESLKRAALKIVFAQHDADGSGALEMEELPKILAEFGVDFDEKRLPDMFNIYDVDRSGALDFEEFSALLKDMHADNAVAEKRMNAYHLPPSLLKEFSPEAIEEMRIHKEMMEIDYDRSGTIEFQEFVTLMRKIRDGEVELDDSAFGRAVLNSAVATRLSQELTLLGANPVPCVESAKASELSVALLLLIKSSPATLRAKIACPSGTPYEGRTMTLELVASDGYPFLPPVAKILERVIQLLQTPDPSLLPDNIRRNSGGSSQRRASAASRDAEAVPPGGGEEEDEGIGEALKEEGGRRGQGRKTRGDDLREKKWGDLHPSSGRVSFWKYAQEMAAGTATFLQEVPAEVVPVVGHMGKAFLAFEQLVETAKSNQQDLVVLRNLCDVVVRGVLTPRANRAGLPKDGFLKLRECVDRAEGVAALCNGVGRWKRTVLSRKIMKDIAGIRQDLLDFCAMHQLVLADDTKAQVDNFANALGSQLDAMRQHTVTQTEYEAMEKQLESRIKELQDVGKKMEIRNRASWELEVELRDLKEELAAIDAEHKERIKVEALAHRVEVPAGAPRIRDWYAERTALVNKTCDHLGIGVSADDSEEPRVIGLAGPSGAGKSTVASMVIARADVRASFHDGVLWLQVGKEAKDRLPELMTRLAGMVHETLVCQGQTCRPPRREDLDGGQEDGGAYIREVALESRRRFLVVADNVWEVEVLQELTRAWVWVLYTTRDGSLVPPPLRVDQVLLEEAELVLRRAADLDDSSVLPEAAYTLMARSSYVVLDLALVGRWSGVRGRSDDKAWRRALRSIENAQCQDHGVAPLSWRAAVLHAGLEELACDNPKHKELYLSLAVVPEGLPFPSEVAAVLLYGEDLSDGDLEAARKVAATLERLSILTLEAGGKYRIHDDHADFVQRIMSERHVGHETLRRWWGYISSVRALVTYSSYSLVKIWEKFAQVGGDWATPQQSIFEALDAADPSSAELPDALRRASSFFWRLKDWRAAYKVNFDLLGIIKNSSFGGSSLEAANTLNSLAACASNAGWRERAEAFSRQALEIRKHVLGGDHLDVAASLYSLGVCVYTPGQTAEAEALFRQALAIRQEKLGDEHLDVAQALYALGVCAYSANRVEEAEGLFRLALIIRQEMLGAGHPDLRSTLSRMAECALAAGRVQEAAKWNGALVCKTGDTSAVFGGQKPPTGYTQGLYGQHPSIGYYAPGGYGQSPTIGSIYGVHPSTGCYAPGGGYGQSPPIIYGVNGQNTVTGYVPGGLGGSPYMSYIHSPVPYAYMPSPVPYGSMGTGGNDTLVAARNWEAEMSCRRELSVQEERFGPTDPIVANTLYKLGGYAAAAGKMREAEEFYRRALMVWKNDAGVHHHKVASTLYELGGCVYAAGRVGEAHNLYREALARQEQTLGADHLQVAHTLCKLGSCADVEGRAGDAEKCFRKALDVFKEKLGVKHLHVANTLTSLGVCVYDAGRMEEGEGCFHQALWIRQAILGAEHADVATALHYLGFCAQQAGKRPLAEDYCYRALTIQVHKPGFMHHPDAGKILYNLGFLAYRAVKTREAEAYFRRALPVQQAQLGLDHPYLGLTLHKLGECARQAGRTEEAEDFYRRALQIREKTRGVDHPSAAETRSALAELRRSVFVEVVWPFAV